LRTALKDSLLATPGNENLRLKIGLYKKQKINDSLALLDRKLDSLIAPLYQKAPHYTFSDEQIQAYKRIGGTPHLDGNYTVYGEVIYGMDVVDKIAKVGTDKNDRPDMDIRMKVTILRKPQP